MKLQTSFELDPTLVISPAELRERYMWGVQVKNQQGEELPDSQYEFFIRSAQRELEDILNIKLTHQKIIESRDYRYDDYCTFGFVRCSYPVCRALSLVGKFGEAEQIRYPKEWLSTKKTTDGHSFYRNMFLLPNVGGYQQGTESGVSFNGIFGANLLWKSRTFIPNYWRVTYITGFDKVPDDILNCIGMAASINVFHIAGDLILGAGIASYSLSVDSLSQSISSTSSATNAGYGARVLGYGDAIKALLPTLRAKYGGFTMTVL